MKLSETFGNCAIDVDEFKKQLSKQITVPGICHRLHISYAEPNRHVMFLIDVDA